MARRAQMLALLQLSSLVFLLVVKVTHTAPVSDNSNINNSDGGDVFSEKHNDADHTVAPGDSVAAVTVHDVNNMSKEEMDVHMVTETVEDTSSAEENLDKDVGSISIKPEGEAGVTEESREVLKVNTDKPNDSLSIRSEDDASAADGSLAVSQVNTDKQEESLVTKTGENGTTESSNAGMHENHTVIETEDDTSAEDTDDAVSNENMEKDEDTITNKTGENTNDAESKENIEKDNDSGKDASTSDSQEGSEENMSKHEVKAIEGNPSKEEIVTAMAEDEINEKSEELLETFKDNKVEKDAVESSDKESEKNKENEAAEETALKTDDTSEDEEKSNEQMLSEHGTGLENSSEEISDAENEAGDIEVNENQNSTHEGSHVTSSPFARLSVPLSDNHHVDKNEHNSDKDASSEDHESNPSVEETAEKETGSPDELIENDSVDSEVIKSDNKTAALGKIMPITGAEKDAQNTDESLHDTSNDSETLVIPTESGETEGTTPVADQDINNKNEEEETTTNEAPKIAHETKSEEIDLNGKLLDGDKDDDDDKDDGDDEEQNEKHNFLDKDDMLPKELDSSSKKNENALYVSEGTFNVDVTENPSDEEGSGIALHMEGFTSHGDSAHKDTFDTSSQEKHEAENRKEEKEGNQDDDVVASEKEEAKLSKETDHHTYDFGESGSGHEEEKPENLGKQDNNGTNDVEDGDGSGSHALLGHYEDEIASEEATTKSKDYSVVYHVPVVDDNEESSTENSSKSPAPENETSTEIASFESPDDQNESGDHLKEENLVQNNTNVQVMSLSPTHAPDESDNHLMEFDGSGDDDTTTPVAIIIHADIIDDNMAVSSKEMDLVNSSLIGEASPAFQEKPVEKVVSSQSAAAPPPPNTESPCTAGEENEDCLLQNNKPHEDTGVTNILEDDDEVALEPTKGAIHTESTTNDDLKEHYLYTTPAVKVSIEEESSQESIAVDLNKPFLHSNEERKSTTIAPETKDITESIEEHEAIDNETTNIGAPDTIVEHPLDESGIKEMSGKIRAANVNELGVSGQENPDDLGEPEALDSSSASGSYVVLGCIMAVVVVLLAYAAIKSRRERGTSVGSKRHSEVAGDDDGTELKDMKKALLTPEAPHDDQNCDIEANTKPLMEKDGNEEDEGKETIIKQNGTLELSEPSRDIESQVDSSTAENPPKTAPTSKKPEERNGLSEVVVEKPPMTNGKADSLITHPVAAKVKVIENEDSIAKMPVIINRGSNSPPH